MMNPFAGYAYLSTQKHIYDKTIYTQFEKYIKMCLPLQV